MLLFEPPLIKCRNAKAQLIYVGPTVEFNIPSGVKRKGSISPMPGVDPLTAHILQRTGTDTNAHVSSGIGGMDAVNIVGLGTGSRPTELGKKVPGDSNAIPQKERKLVTPYDNAWENLLIREQ